MKLKRLGANVVEVEKENGAAILFSYDTPVAARIWESKGAVFPRQRVYLKSARFFSRTTTKHVNAWIPEGVKPAVLEHERIVALAEGL